MDKKQNLKKEKYQPSVIEPKWQKKWEEKGIYRPNLNTASKPFYNLMMFPYPSAEGMHVGNMYAFTGSDIYGRYQRMKGNSVFEPIGLDGFGIHSENYALKIGRHPMEQAKVSEKNFYRQLRATGNGFDWSRTVETYKPEYYKWTQWVFIQMFKKGLAYRKKAKVNFCPSCKTVLADEQVIDGKCERCSSIIEQKELKQWFFRITEYAEKLLQNIEKLDWSEKVKIAQKNWIGKKEGINIKYSVIASPASGEGEAIPSLNEIAITCFTTRPDTNFGATFIVVGPEHPFVASLLKLKTQNSKLKTNEIKDYIERAKAKSELERIAEGRKKTGVFTGFYAINDLNGKKLPIWISDFVLGNVGTGAVVGVPGHDIRDFEFAKEFNLPIVRVVVGKDGDSSPITKPEQVQEKEGTMISSEFLNGMGIHEATKKIMDYLEQKGWGKKITTFHLRDWLISRQRYWGPPIPMIFCESCASQKIGYFELRSEKLDNESLNSRNLDIKKSKIQDQENPTSNVKDSDSMSGWFPAPEDQLPVELPYIKDYRPLGTGESPLSNHPDFYKTKCPNCSGEAKRETDVSDTFLDSSWYFFRYLCTECKDIPFPSEAFIKNSKFKARNSKQYQNTNDKNSKRFRISDFDIRNLAQRIRWLPVDMYIGGAEHSVLHLLYSRFITMVLNDLGLINFDEPYKKFRAHGLIIAEGAKMSKSKGNVVVPDEYIRKYGADTLRTYLMFMAPFTEGGDFRDAAIEGIQRFLKRVWQVVLLVANKNSSKEEQRILNQTIKKVTEDIERLHYNTAISALMELLNFISKQQQADIKTIKSFLIMLAPFAPHLAEELWQRFRYFELRSEKLDNESLNSRNQDIKKSKIQDQENPTSNLKDSDFNSIHHQPWPIFDPKLLEEEEVTIVVQVNGKARETIRIQNSEFRIQNLVEEEAKESEKVKRHLEGKKIKKVVYIEGKVINFVTE